MAIINSYLNKETTKTKSNNMKYNTKKSNNVNSNVINVAQLDKYYLSIIDDKTKISEEMSLTDIEFKILNLAVRHNKGIINLLSEVEAIKSLINKGLITISNDKLGVLTVTEEIKCIFQAMLDISEYEDFTLEENRPSSFFKVCNNKSIYLCLLA
ncbi:MAG TPA: hypothetical protein VLL98_01045 [Rickettsiales bacterium]|nr:hypothetical protein [Rickettsiales bacterium]